MVVIDMNKRRVLVVKENENFGFMEKFYFYHISCGQKSRLYSKIVEIFPSIHIDFYILHLPSAKNDKENKYLAQYINFMKSYLQTENLHFFYQDSKIKNYLHDFNTQISCVIYCDRIGFLKKYAKKCGIHLKNSRILLLCDDPLQAKDAICQIYREVYQIELYCLQCSRFDDMIHTFSEEYGIFIKASDNILEKEKKNTLVLSVSDNKELLKKYNKEEFLPILNISSRKQNITNMYENAAFYGNREINKTAEKLGGFTGNTLLFLYKCLFPEPTADYWNQFLKDYEIKCVKLLKND